MVLISMLSVLTFMTMMMILIMVLRMILTMMLMILNDDTDDDADDGGRGNRRPVPGGAVHFPAPRAPPLGEGVRTNFQDLDAVEGKGEGKQRCSNTPQDLWRGRRILME